MELNFNLNHLDCANCANKIENKLAESKIIQEVHLNFANKKLWIKCKEENQMQVRDEIKTTIHYFEPDVSLEEENVETITYEINGLDCASCKEKIEKAIKALPEVSDAYINFANQQLMIRVNKAKISSLYIKVTKIVKEIEPDCTLKSAESEVIEEHHRYDFLSLCISFCLFIIGLYFKESRYAFLIFLTAFILVGSKVVIKAIRNVLHGEIWDENFLMSIATIGAFLIGDYGEGVGVMLFYEVGELLQSYAVNHSRKSIQALMKMRPDFVNQIVDGRELSVDPEQIEVGDVVLYKAGERVALDGVLLSEKACFDTSALSGEAYPNNMVAGDGVLAGYINLNSVIKIKVSKVLSESSIARILELVQNASNRKAPSEKFITKFAHYYTPTVVFAALALVIIPTILGYGEFHTWLYRGLSFLVISCPCALVISIPLALFAGIGGASRNGILIKGGNYLEAIKNIDCVVFDKTGTLTKGVFKVLEIVGEDQDELLKVAAYGESFSTHPIATSIVNAYKGEIDHKRISDFMETSGKGISFLIDNQRVFIGNQGWLKDHHRKAPEIKEAGTIVYVVKNQEYLGYLRIGDEIKESSKAAIATLKQLGVSNIVMLSGDQKQNVEALKEELSLDEAYGELSPAGKVELLESLLNKQAVNKKVAFVGDGINDAPVIARADIGFAMGGIGSDAAMEAADVVLMKDDPFAICDAIRISKRTRKIVMQNIIFALGIKVLVLLASSLGYANMWWGVFADVGVTLLAVMNSMRLLSKH
ncbi:MAG: heavy metal translocating P-type ATPase [Erysipelotrichaceae bacterium]